MIANLALVLIMLCNFDLLGATRLHHLIRTMAFQGLLLSLLPLLVPHDEPWFRLGALVAGTIFVKCYFIPSSLLRALERVRIRLEVEPYISPMTSLFLCGLGTFGAISVANVLPLMPDHAGTLIVPASLSTVFTGFLLLVSRRKAITQVVGYVVLENGIYLFGLLLLGSMPVAIETGVLLDLLAGILVMGVIINHIQREFSSLDVGRLSALKEE